VGADWVYNLLAYCDKYISIKPDNRNVQARKAIKPFDTKNQIDEMGRQI
jgi:hypothetical protein